MEKNKEKKKKERKKKEKRKKFPKRRKIWEPKTPNSGKFWGGL